MLRGVPTAQDTAENSKKERKRKKRSRREKSDIDSTLPPNMDIVTEDDNQLGRHSDKSGSGEGRRRRRRKQRNADDDAYDQNAEISNTNDAKVVNDRGTPTPDGFDFANPGVGGDKNSRGIDGQANTPEQNLYDNNNGGADANGNQDGEDPDFGGQDAFF